MTPSHSLRSQARTRFAFVRRVGPKTTARSGSVPKATTLTRLTRLSRGELAKIHARQHTHTLASARHQLNVCSALSNQQYTLSDHAGRTFDAVFLICVLTSTSCFPPARRVCMPCQTRHFALSSHTGAPHDYHFNGRQEWHAGRPLRLYFHGPHRGLRRGRLGDQPQVSQAA